MKKKSVYITGYTLLEIIFAMILTALVLGIFYWAFAFIKKQAGLYFANQDALKTLLIFENTITDDIEKADYIQTDDAKTYYFVTGQDTSIYYFDTIITLKRGNRTDTFSISTDMKEPDYIALMRGAKAVRQINYDITKPILITNTVHTKYYSAQQLYKVPQ